MVSTFGQNDAILSKCSCTLGSPCAVAILTLCGKIFLKVLSSNSPLYQVVLGTCKVANLVGVGSSVIFLNFSLSEKSFSRDV